MRNRLRELFTRIGILRRIYQKVIRIRTALFGYGVFENVNRTAYEKNCLLMYIIEPFKGQNINYKHQNNWQAKELARVIGEFGYNVDVIRFNDKRARLTKKYDLVIDLHPGINLLYTNHLNPDAKKVAYITGSNPSFSNEAEKERVADIYRRHGVRLQLRRQTHLFDPKVLSSFEAMFFIGNEYNLRTYRGSTPPQISFIKNTGYDFLAEPDHSERLPTVFMFLSSSGQAHKGLDLLLEVFLRNPSLQLYVCSSFKTEADFTALYEKELYESPNIFPVGFIDIASAEFKNTAKKCTYVIMPSCSEARAGSILTGMSAGLIPIASRDCGFDDDEVIQLADCRLETIEHTILEYAQKPREWREQEAERMLSIVNNRYNKNDFSDSVRKAILSLLQT